jgi:uncharacterized ion transporter superfamily protein YfcC
MPGTTQEESYIKIGKKTFITALVILLLLIVAVGILTLVVPTGSYDRVTADGREAIVQDSFHFTEASRFPVWRWLTAPVEVLFSADSAVVIVIIFFLLAVSIAFSMLEKSNVMSLAISRAVRRFSHVKYLMMAVIVFFFMIMGAVLGTFEENIALVQIIVALSYCLGWDSLVGLGMSMLASCFGFTAAVTNPFSIAITQKIADLPLYSGFGYRVVIFAAYYALVFMFLYRYARRIEKDPSKSLIYGEDNALRGRYRDIGAMEQMLRVKTPEEHQKLKHATVAFGLFILVILAVVLIASFVSFLSDLILPLIGIFILLGGVVSAAIAGVSWKDILRLAGKAVAGITPGIVLILLAMSVKFIIYNGGIMDTILYYISGAIRATSPYAAILLIYVLILVLELFVGSSSAKAFLVMPLITPLSDLVGITRQTSVLAFCFGDGFSNMLYPTNPVLLICLGLTVVTFPKWFKWTWKLQLGALVFAVIFLIIGVAAGYGPF